MARPGLFSTIPLKSTNPPSGYAEQAANNRQLKQMQADMKLDNDVNNQSRKEPSSGFSLYPSSLVQVDLAALSHQGLVRSNNEDHFLVARASRSLELLITNLPEGTLPQSFDESAYGMLVADGMGGMAAGEVASSLALRKLLELVVQTPDWVMRIDEGKYADIAMQRMSERFRRVDEAIKAESESNNRLAGMGTTLTTAVSGGADLFLGHIGDSRAYLFSNKRLRKLTRDHTLSQALIDAGIILPGDEATRRMRHVLTAALGSASDLIDAEVQHLQLFEGDQLLLCTDGLTDMVDDQTIGSVLKSAKSSSEACQSLLDLALSAGGRDNITMTLARYHFSLT
jgi:protein phosphatase